MTFTKEKLAELALAVSRTECAWGFKDNDEDYIENYYGEQEVLKLIEAGKALPHYITALAEAERALDDGVRRLRDWKRVHGTDASTEIIIMGCDSALTTIRQLARGKE